MPANYDPSLTGAVRKAMETELHRRFAKFRADLLRQFAHAVSDRHTHWQAMSDVDRVRHLHSLTARLVTLHITGSHWWESYVQRCYAQTADRTYSTIVPGILEGEFTSKELLEGGLHSVHPALHRRESKKPTITHNAKHDIRDTTGKFIGRSASALALRLENELVGATLATSQRISRVLIDGMTRGDTTEKIAQGISDAVDFGMNRSLLIARTELVRIAAEAQLDVMESLGISHVTAVVEWSTLHDGRVCPMCKPLDGVVLKVSEARGMLPRHPNCRCAWSVARGLDYAGRTRTGKAITQRREVQRAIARSKRVDRGDSDWGPATPIGSRSSGK